MLPDGGASTAGFGVQAAHAAGRSMDLADAVSLAFSAAREGWLAEILETTDGIGRPPFDAPRECTYGQTAAVIVAEARTHIEELTVEEVAAGADNPDVVLVDVREPGRVGCRCDCGALNIPRGMLEFRADPTSPYHEPVLLPERRVILHCANGGRSALAAAALTGIWAMATSPRWPAVSTPGSSRVNRSCRADDEENSR